MSDEESVRLHIKRAQEAWEYDDVNRFALTMFYLQFAYRTVQLLAIAEERKSRPEIEDGFVT